VTYLPKATQCNPPRFKPLWIGVLPEAAQGAVGLIGFVFSSSFVPLSLLTRSPFHYLPLLLLSPARPSFPIIPLFFTFCVLSLFFFCSF
jgi:hypothetical protein